MLFILFMLDFYGEIYSSRVIKWENLNERFDS